MATRRRSPMTNAISRLLDSPAFTPLQLALLLVLALGVGVNALMRIGDWPPSFAQPSTSIIISTPPSPSPSTARHAIVLGAVRTPGEYPLQPGAQAKDLIQFAGGALTTADLSRVDLTVILADGASVYVPRNGEVIPVEIEGRLALNRASESDLHNALGLTSAISKRIVAYRTAHGNFTAIGQLLLVPISQTIFDRIKNLVAV